MKAMRLQIFFYGDPCGYPPIINGVRCLAARGWSVDVICRGARTHPDVAFPASVNIRRLGGDSSPSKGEYLQFAFNALRLSDPHAAVYAGHDMHGLVVAGLAGALRRVPFFYHCHDFAEASRKLPLGSTVVKRLERIFARRAVFTVVPDERRAAVVSAELGLDAPALVVPNSPCDTQAPLPGALRNKLRSMGLSPRHIFFRQGRIGPGHGIEATVRSLPHWRSPDWAFVAMGPAEERFVETMKALAREVGAENRFAVLPTVGYDELPSYTADADVGHALYEPVNVNHQQMGTASNKILEYMAQGVPCIVSSSSSAADLVEAHGCGLSADPCDPAQIAAALNTLIERPGLRDDMARSGREAFRTKLSYELHFNQLERRLLQLVGDEG
jgi:glycosyltransferase involved in cell wall biosynthesis